MLTAWFKTKCVKKSASVLLMCFDIFNLVLLPNRAVVRFALWLAAVLTTWWDKTKDRKVERCKFWLHLCVNFSWMCGRRVALIPNWNWETVFARIWNNLPQLSFTHQGWTSLPDFFNIQKLTNGNYWNLNNFVKINSIVMKFPDFQGNLPESWDL